MPTVPTGCLRLHAPSVQQPPCIGLAPVKQTRQALLYAYTTRSISSQSTARWKRGSALCGCARKVRREQLRVGRGWLPHPSQWSPRPRQKVALGWGEIADRNFKRQNHQFSTQETSQEFPEGTNWRRKAASGEVGGEAVRVRGPLQAWTVV